MNYEQTKLFEQIARREYNKMYPEAKEETTLIISNTNEKPEFQITISGFSQYAKPKLQRLEKHLQKNKINYYLKEEPGSYKKSVRIPIKEIPEIIKIPDDIEDMEEFSGMYMIDGIITDTKNINEIKGDIKHIKYEGDYPTLCRGWWIIQIGSHTICLNELESGGFAGYDMFEPPTKGIWKLMKLPQWLEPRREELEKLANAHIPQGCCNGCT